MILTLVAIYLETKTDNKSSLNLIYTWKGASITRNVRKRVLPFMIERLHGCLTFRSAFISSPYSRNYFLTVLFKRSLGWRATPSQTSCWRLRPITISWARDPPLTPQPSAVERLGKQGRPLHATRHRPPVRPRRVWVTWLYNMVFRRRNYW